MSKPLPLVYNVNAEAVNDLAEQDLCNPGLIWDRYFPLWDGSEREKNIYDSLSHFVNRFNARKKHQEHILTEQQQRYKRILKQLARSRKLAPIFSEARLMWRFATGLGNDHPTENGFSFDHTTGLPVIAGTMVKGMCRAAAPSLGWNEKEIERLFGPSEISSGINGWQSCLFFFDAYPKEWPELTVDIVNCHHQKYYSTVSETSPKETEDTNPVHFISVKRDARFLFPLLVPEEEKTRIEELLKNAVSLFGVGAKTAVGYGRFSHIIANFGPNRHSNLV